MNKGLNRLNELVLHDKVWIESLTVLASIGVYDWEQTIKQRLELDIVMYWDNRQAALSDDVSDCLNYAAISEAVTHYISAGKFALIERVAEEIAQLLLVNYHLPAVEVTVRKPTAVASANQVGVTILRLNDSCS
ncbi:dihydroneopterin aldolase [Thorsellia anophelis]|uniref:7,8-dihydroneopterin aldolase n=1 Tax=Thorsellia anophelis DSM 18579 TaxID=1123402 RepID=A0A1H9Y6Q4_9GAMM|nr:dihydroneopterin aldolase [Thorsellia anophelis]SES64568.1 dihydroneopterin aldolase [Thorsellia anophelis DSM 18579]